MKKVPLFLFKMKNYSNKSTRVDFQALVEFLLYFPRLLSLSQDNKTTTIYMSYFTLCTSRGMYAPSHSTFMSETCNSEEMVT